MGIHRNRPNTAQKYMNIQAMLLSPIKEFTRRNLKTTAPASGAALPQLTISTVVTRQEYTSADYYADTMVCAMTSLKVGDTVCFQVNDEVASQSNALYAFGDVRMVVPLHSAATVTQGGDVYRRTADGLFTHDSASADWCGRFVEASARSTYDGLETHDDGFAIIDFTQGEKV